MQYCSQGDCNLKRCLRPSKALKQLQVSEYHQKRSLYFERSCNRSKPISHALKDQFFNFGSHSDHVDKISVQYDMKDPRDELAKNTDTQVYIGHTNLSCNYQEEDTLRRIRIASSLKAQGVCLDVYWACVENQSPQQYNFKMYHRIFEECRRLGLSVKAKLRFDVTGQMSMPNWILNIANQDPDIFFKDQNGRMSYGCLTFGIDSVRKLDGRCGLEVYFQFMQAFSDEFCAYIDSGVLTEVSIGMGPNGEARYPSQSGCPVLCSEVNCEKHQLQCYDRYLRTNLEAETGIQLPQLPTQSSNSPQNVAPLKSFFDADGECTSDVGHQLLIWYSRVLLRHVEHMLIFASIAFQGQDVALDVSVPGVHWQRDGNIHPAQSAAGYFDSRCHDGYVPLFETLAKYGASATVQCVKAQDYSKPHDPQCSSEGILSHFRALAMTMDVPLSVVNTLPRFDDDVMNVMEQVVSSSNKHMGVQEEPVQCATYLCDLDMLEKQADTAQRVSQFLSRLADNILENQQWWQKRGVVDRQKSNRRLVPG